MGLGYLRSLRCLVALVALSSVAFAGAAGAAAAAGPKPSLTLRASVVFEREIRAEGSVRPAPDRGRVALELRRHGAWQRLGRPAAVHRGTFSVRAVVPLGVDEARLRAALYEGGRLRGASPIRSLRLPDSPSTPTGPPLPAPGPPSTTPAPGASPPPSAPPPSGPPPASAPPPTEAPGNPVPPPNPLSADLLMATVDRYASLPNHLSGTPNGAAAEDQFTEELAAAGLTIGEQAFTYPRFTPTAVGLSVGGSAVPAAALAPFLYSGATPAGGVTAPLFYAGEGKKEGDVTFTEADVKGKIVVAKIPYQTNSKALGLYPAVEKSVEGGAVGFVAVTQAVGDQPKWEDTNARRETGSLPTLSVGKVSGQAVIAAAEAGGTATLTLAADHSGLSCERDVWGELEGVDPSRRVYIGVPVTSYTPSASEHGTGFAIVIGLARHYAALPKAERPETLVFLGLGGHEIGWLGLQALLASPQGDLLRDADGYVHLGSALGAPEAKEEADGTIATAAAPDPTGRLHESENPLLTAGVIEDFAAAGAPAPETPPKTASGGEQTNAFAAGIPTASFSGASLFFHTAEDTPATIDESILERQADAFRRVIDRITAIPAGQLRAQNDEAAKNGEKLKNSGEAEKRTPANPTLGAVRGNLGQNALHEGGVGGPPATPVADCP